jgi:hypothetical protein
MHVNKHFVSEELSQRQPAQPNKRRHRQWVAAMQIKLHFKHIIIDII